VGLIGVPKVACKEYVKNIIVMAAHRVMWGPSTSMLRSSSAGRSPVCTRGRHV
jgi:hypothetical protein